MEIISINNQKIKEICKKFTELEYNDLADSQPKRWELTDTYQTAFDYATSDASLISVLNGGNYIKKSCYKIFGETEAGAYFLSNIKSILKYDEYYTAAYWPKGFISWHTDDDVQGYCLMLTWSAEGAGFFKYKDPVTNKTITIEDQPGWSAKAMSLGNDTTAPVWHCAGGDGSRWTIILVFNNQNYANWELAKATCAQVG